MCGNKPEIPSTLAQDLLQKDILFLTPCVGYPSMCAPGSTSLAHARLFSYVELVLPNPQPPPGDEIFAAQVFTASVVD